MKNLKCSDFSIFSVLNLFVLFMKNCLLLLQLPLLISIMYRCMYVCVCMGYIHLLMKIVMLNSFSFCWRNVKKESMKGFSVKNLLLLWHISTSSYPQSRQLYIYPGIWPNTLKGRKNPFCTSACSCNVHMEANVTEQNSTLQTKQENVIQHTSFFVIIHSFLPRSYFWITESLVEKNQCDVNIKEF